MKNLLHLCNIENNSACVQGKVSVHHEGSCYNIDTSYHHYYKHQGLDTLIRPVSRVTNALANVSSVFQLFSFLVVCSDMISKGFGLVAFFASVKASFVCIHLSCPVCIQSVVHGVRSRLFCGHEGCSLPEVIVKITMIITIIINYHYNQAVNIITNKTISLYTTLY